MRKESYEKRTEMKKVSLVTRIKTAGILAILFICTGILTACGGGADDTITVISREEGSGTRGAFIELFGIEQKDADGKKVDKTIVTADQTNSTGVMLTSVGQNNSAIGYVSLGSLNDTVKAVKIEGAEASVENIKNGTYKVSRPFLIATGASVKEDAQDFINYILSSEGQAIVEEKGYIPVGEAVAYSGKSNGEKVIIAGSSSVSPLMEKLMEAYKKVNANANLELQTSDSTTGVNSVAEGIADIGMASRELKASESDKGLAPTVIAMDGIAVIVNKNNTVEDLKKDEVMGIYTGTVTKWSDLK